MKSLLPVLLLSGALCGWITVAPAADKVANPDSIATETGPVKIHPISHATLALQWQDKTLYVDPVGAAKLFEGLPRPDLILLTDIHGDHLSKETLASLAGPATRLVGPPAAVEQLPPDLARRATALANGQSQEMLGFRIEAIPAYNLTPDRQKYHAKGRGNGYLLTIGGKRLYVSGDTEATPEMLALKNIDLAFLCMNLPYTMDVEQAARAVRSFKPRVVYPYHYRGSDLEKFKTLVGADAGVEVRLRDWYPKP